MGPRQFVTHCVQNRVSQKNARIMARFDGSNPLPNSDLRRPESSAMRVWPYPARCCPCCSCSTMTRPISPRSPARPKQVIGRLLFLFDNDSPNFPVGRYHRGIDGAIDAARAWLRIDLIRS